MKRFFVLALASIMLICVGCGKNITREEYNQIVAKYDELDKRVKKAIEDYDELMEEYIKLQDEFEKYKATPTFVRLVMEQLSDAGQLGTYDEETNTLYIYSYPQISKSEYRELSEEKVQELTMSMKRLCSSALDYLRAFDETMSASCSAMSTDGFILCAVKNEIVIIN